MNNDVLPIIYRYFYRYYYIAMGLVLLTGVSCLLWYFNAYSTVYVHSRMGIIFAWHYVFYIFGLGSYVLFSTLFYALYLMYHNRQQELIGRCLLDIMCVINICVLEQWSGFSHSGFTEVPGGLCGVFVIRLLHYFFNQTSMLWIIMSMLGSVFVVLVYVYHNPESLRTPHRIVFVGLQYLRMWFLIIVQHGKKAWLWLWNCFICYIRQLSVVTIAPYHGVVDDEIQQEYAAIELDRADYIQPEDVAYVKENVQQLKDSRSAKVENREQEEPVVQKNVQKKERIREHKRYESRRYSVPSSNLLSQEKITIQHDVQASEQRARLLEEKLARFGVEGKVVSIKQGPVVTMFEYAPHIDTKLSKIVALENDLSLALQALSIRIIAPIPGTAVVGFEVANHQRHAIPLSCIIRSKECKQFSGYIPLILGVDTVGNSVCADLATMPHLLLAGSTGSGKSVALNVLLMSMLFRCTPDELKLILIDPKRLEFAPYHDLPHLLFPVVVNPKDAAPVLQWVVHEMERRYEHMATQGVRTIHDYNTKAALREKMPFIVVMIDELADLMMVAGKDIEERIARIAQMARAAGIHMIIATQRPSVDVVTGIIKANFPTRIAFRVASSIDSRTILDAKGADALLGKGDMLVLTAGGVIRRIHGPFVTDHEIEQITTYIKSMREPSYLELPTLGDDKETFVSDGDEQLYQDVLIFLETVDEISISLVQRRFRIGYNRSARIIEMLEAEGRILPSNGGKMRRVLK